MVTHELGAVVGVDLVHWEGQARKAAAEAIAGYPVAAPQDGGWLDPAGSHINHLQRMQILPGSTGATMVHQVHLKVPGLSDLPRDTSDRNLGLHCAVRRRGPARPARFILMLPTPNPSYRGHTDTL